MESKDLIAIGGIGVTLLVSSANFIYTLWSSKRTMFVNTVTASRLKWIDSLRDKVSEFLAVTARLMDPSYTIDQKESGSMLLERDTLLHQIVLHLNPHDPEDQKIQAIVDHVRELSDRRTAPDQLRAELAELRGATADYLKKEWNRVKRESAGS